MLHYSDIKTEYDIILVDVPKCLLFSFSFSLENRTSPAYIFFFYLETYLYFIFIFYLETDLFRLLYKGLENILCKDVILGNTQILLEAHTHDGKRLCYASSSQSYLSGNI